MNSSDTLRFCQQSHSHKVNLVFKVITHMRYHCLLSCASSLYLRTKLCSFQKFTGIELRSTSFCSQGGSQYNGGTIGNNIMNHNFIIQKKKYCIREQQLLICTFTGTWCGFYAPSKGDWWTTKRDSIYHRQKGVRRSSLYMCESFMSSFTNSTSQNIEMIQYMCWDETTINSDLRFNSSLWIFVISHHASFILNSVIRSAAL